jgi:hypothetical protein
METFLKHIIKYVNSIKYIIYYLKKYNTVLVDEIFKLIDIEIEDLSSEDITSKIKLKYIY